ncbi:class I SAM-dependent methyltransferase [Novosphingobium album (ex Liu et al. 2023)]|uniref:Methyltransferase domain-containing protein n=1 Tax=Novosphingobium album (ex Liu et al. 2023) TaxID=3031130 RepID=A0ABT5WNG7_9SPHN|nr:methyltransferase domain-containing protein [Novosphingobium album (ex Liu et al. 2023)]MDE8651579.1 methyltransferase domain-containing protein [Novosphingobium album (ex Liu et al. 2023)]
MTIRNPPEMEPIDFSDAKTAFVIERCRGKRVLDLGCVMHDIAHYQSRHFLHRAIAEVAQSVIGLDLHREGIEHLRSLGYDARGGNAENFDFDEPFDVIVAGDIVEHLSNLDGLLSSCLRNLTPDGHIIVQSPNPWYWRNCVKAVLYREVPNNAEHTCWFCPRNGGNSWNAMD